MNSTFDTYVGAYMRFETPSKKDAAVLLGADNLVGDPYEIEFELREGTYRAWLKSRFGQRIGYFDDVDTRTLRLYLARDLTLKAVLSYVAYTDTPDPGHYWGEAAVFAYDQTEIAFSEFIKGVAKKISEGIRPRIDLGQEGIEHIVSSGGAWLPDQTVPLPSKTKGTVILKSRRSLSERVIEQGRKGNKGCYVASWLFLLALVALVIFGLHSCGLF